MQKTTIFRQLILNVIIPVVIALLMLGILNYQNTKSILQESNEKKNQIISDEIKNIMGFQDMALNIVEEGLDKDVESASEKLIKQYFIDTRKVVESDLKKIQEQIGMDPKMEDIYIIDAQTGVIVNTTYEKDRSLNVFNFGESFKKFLMDVVKNKKFVSERFSIEMSTNRIKKYTYRPTPDGKYIIETGHYSKKADDIKEHVKQRFNRIMRKDSSIAFVGLYIGADEPFELNSGEKIKKNDGRKKMLLAAFADKKRKSLDTIETDKIKNIQRHLRYDFFYMERKNTTLYKSSVITIVSDRTSEIKLLRFELIKSLLIFGITLFVVILLIYKKTKSITLPLKKLVNNVLRISAGNFEERAEVEGNNEITTLSVKFNEMLGTIEGYYNVLEEKVRERTAQVVKQKDQIEEQKKRITDSIIYAKRIQDAILPPVEIITKLLKNAFVLYKPREIVSGDFYWITEHNERVIVAAVDCTGHGVPGAFMSMLGYAFLNEIVSKSKEIHANEILFRLRANVVAALRQTDEIGSSKDGMDIALCIIDHNNLTLQFAGANNPLYIVSSLMFEALPTLPTGQAGGRQVSSSTAEPNLKLKTSDYKLHEVKSDKIPIGITRKGMVPYTNHEISLQKNDVIYIFSDGYPDQFGGPENWKFMSSNFKNLLLEIHDKPMEEQKTILDKNIEEWRSGREQTDDILVIGIRI